MDINIRAMMTTDLTQLLSIDHSYHTDHVWQMELDTAETSVSIRFREIRLPRSMKVDYPRNLDLFAETWKQKAVVLVAEVEEELAGYLALTSVGVTGLAQVTDFAVLRRLRKNGIGTSLVRSAMAWMEQHGAGQLALEMQSKNYPAICLANKLGFEFCGYNDRYYFNQDIALFFAKRR
jgi:ribosomal protein S18 acetylase RimI-like enzyme